MTASDHASTAGAPMRLFRRLFAFALLRGVVYIIVGTLMLFEPTSTLTWLIWLFAIFAAVQGLVTLFDAFQRRGAGSGTWYWWAILGVLGVAAGVVVAVWPDITGIVLLRLVGVWALIAGLVEAASALRDWRSGQPAGDWKLAIGLLTVVFGLVLLLRTDQSVDVIGVLIAIYLLFTGIVIVVSSAAVRAAVKEAAGPPP